MRGQSSEIAFPDAILRCADFPQSAFRLWVQRPGQDLNLRGVTQRFSRPPPYRARRPGQRFILKTKARISVSHRRHKIDAGKRVARTTDSMRVIGGVLAPRLTDFGFPEARGRRQRRRRMSEPP